MRLTPLGYAIGLASEERYRLMMSKREQRDMLIDFAASCTVHPADVNAWLESIGTSPLRQGVKLRDLITRPELTIEMLAGVFEPLRARLESVEPDRRAEIVEAAEILIKYQGYIDRERLTADKIKRLEDLRLGDRFDYSTIHAISTEARQKLDRIRPETVAQASRIPGISPADINILLLMLGR